MSDRNKSSLPFEGGDAEEQALWSALDELPVESPPASLRRDFYRALDHASNESWWVRLGGLLGFGSNTGWLTAAACLLAGFGIAGLLDDQGSGGEDVRLAMLEENVATLNRQLILDRLLDADAGVRLKGVFDARNAVEDEEIVRALLQRASADRVPSVRSAAIDILGARLPAAGVGDELMRLLEHTESPTVQLALVDMLLRNGSRSQLDQLLALAREDRLHPDIARHVTNSLGSERA